MSVIAYEIKDKWWSNDSWKQPNALPTIFEKEKTFNRSPKIINLLGGFIRLRGGNWNWLKYKGTHYHLEKADVLHLDAQDDDNCVYLYAVINDLWCNVVLKRIIEVLGDLGTWNHNRLLEANINRCVRILENPAQITRFNCVEGKIPWYEVVKVLEITKELPIEVLSNENYKTFIGALTSKNYENFKKAQNYLFEWRKDCYIFSILTGTYDKDSWKEILKKRINEDLKKLRSDKKRLVVKVTQAAIPKLQGKYAISLTDSAIGTTEQNFEPEKIDLSELTDIRAIDPKSLEARAATEEFSKDTFVFHINEPEEVIKKRDLILKVRRKVFLPGSKWRHFYGNRTKQQSKGWYSENVGSDFWCQQNAKFKDDEKEGYFYFIDRQDFDLSFSTNKLTVAGYYLYGFEKRAIDNPKSSPDGLINLKEYFGHKWGWTIPGKTWWQIPGSWTITATAAYSIWTRVRHPIKPNTQWRWDIKKGEWIWNRLKEHVPGYGFLIFQLHRPYEEWDRYEYTGAGTVTKLHYYSGLNANFLRDRIDGAENKWWSIASETGSAELCGNLTLTKIFLYLYHLRFRYFLPDTKVTSDEYEYKRIYSWYNDSYDIQKFLAKADASNNSNLYVSSLNLATFSDGQKSPYQSKKDYEKWLRDEKEDRDFWNLGVLKKELSFEGLEIKRGDFFFSSLDYEITAYASNPWPNDGGKQIRDALSSWFARSWNLLEDFIVPQPSTPFLGQPEYKNRKLLVICSNLKGELEARELSQYSANLTLSEEVGNAIESISINDEAFTDSNTQTFYHLKNLNASISNVTREKHREWYNFFAAFYRTLGYDVVIPDSASAPRGFWNCPSKEEAEGKKKGWQLYDLVGTNWYVVQNDGQFHYICKDNNIFKEIKTRADEKFFKKQSWEAGKNLSLLQKINQINIVRYKSAKLPIRHRFSFTEDEPSIFIEAKPISGGESISMMQNFDFVLRTPFDTIETIVSSTKSYANKDIQLADHSTLDAFKLQMLRAQQERDMQSRWMGLDQELIDIQAKRALWDLNYTRVTKGIGTAFDAIGLLGFGINKAASFKVGRINSAASLDADWMIDYLMPKNDPTMSQIVPKGRTPNRDEVWKILANPEIATKKHWKDFYSSEMHVKGWRNARSIGHHMNKNSDIFSGLINGILDLSWKLPEQARRIAEDKKIKYERLAERSLNFDISYLEKKQDAEIAINRITHSYSYTDVTDDLLESEFRKERGLSELHIECRVPNAEQLIAMNAHKKEYGVDCDIPNQNVVLKSGMPENVIRFRNIRDRGIKGISSQFEYKWLEALLLRGVKVVEVADSAPDYDYHSVVHHIPVAVDVQKYLDKEQELSTQLITKTEEIAGLLAAAEATKEKLANVEKIEKDLEAATNRADTLHNALEKKEQELTEETNLKNLYLEQKNKLHQEKEQCEQKVKLLENDLQKKKEENEKLEAEKAKLLSERTSDEDIAKLKEELKSEIARIKDIDWTIKIGNRDDCEELKKSFDDIFYIGRSKYYPMTYYDGLVYTHEFDQKNKPTLNTFKQKIISQSRLGSWKGSYNKIVCWLHDAVGYDGTKGAIRSFNYDGSYLTALFTIWAMYDRNRDSYFYNYPEMRDMAFKLALSSNDGSNSSYEKYWNPVLNDGGVTLKYGLWRPIYDWHIDNVDNPDALIGKLTALKKKLCPETEADLDGNATMYAIQMKNTLGLLRYFKNLAIKSATTGHNEVDEDPTHWKWDYFLVKIEEWNEKDDPWAAFEKEFLTKTAAFGLDDNEFDQKGWYLYFLYDIQRLLGWNQYQPDEEGNGYVLPIFYENFYWYTDYLKNSYPENHEHMVQMHFDEDGDKRVKILQKFIRHTIFSLVRRIVNERSRQANQKSPTLYDHSVLRIERNKKDYYPSLYWKDLEISHWKNLFRHNTYIRDLITEGWDKNFGYDAVNIADLVKAIDKNYVNLKYRIKENYITNYEMGDQSGRVIALWPKGKWHSNSGGDGLWEAVKWDTETRQKADGSGEETVNVARARLFKYTGVPNTPSLSLITNLILCMMNIKDGKVMDPVNTWQYDNYEKAYKLKADSNKRYWEFIASGCKIKWTNFLYVIIELIDEKIIYDQEINDEYHDGQYTLKIKMTSKEEFREKLINITDPHLFAEWADPILKKVKLYSPIWTE